MTTEVWQASDDPVAMARDLWNSADPANVRRVRLFAVACCRQSQIWNFIPGALFRNAVTVAERYANHQATAEQLREANNQVSRVYGQLARSQEYTSPEGQHASLYGDDDDRRRVFAVRMVQLALNPHIGGPVDRVSRIAGDIMDASATILSPDAAPRVPLSPEQRQIYGHLLWDMFPDPNVKPPPVIDPNWLAWNDGTIPRIARAIYDEEAWDRMPILADAFEDAGCDNAAILANCRSDRPHVRGTWVIDSILCAERERVADKALADTVVEVGDFLENGSDSPGQSPTGNL